MNNINICCSKKVWKRWIDTYTQPIWIQTPKINETRPRKKPHPAFETGRDKISPAKNDIMKNIKRQIFAIPEKKNITHI